MKYKLLLGGKNNATMDDFFYAMNEDFECMTTSLRPRDVLLHLQMFQPDAFVYCMTAESSDSIAKMMSSLKAVLRRQKNLILIAAAETCNEFMRSEPDMVDLVLAKPITAKSIQEEIVKFLVEMQNKAEAEAQKNAELQTVPEVQKVLEDTVPQEAVGGLTEEKSPKHILIIDDDPLMLRVIKEELKDEYNVATAISGKIGLNFLQRKTTDLILLDYEMPEENGPQVLEKLRANESTKNIPVIFLTGINDKEKIQKVLAMKPQGYLLKPIDHTKLVQAIEQTLG